VALSIEEWLRDACDARSREPRSYPQTRSDSTPGLDDLLLNLYVTLDDEFPAQRLGRPQATNDAEMVCIAVAGALLGRHTERGWLRLAGRRIGHLFPAIPQIAQYNHRVKRLAPMFARAMAILGSRYPEVAERLLIVDTTPVPCATSVATVERSRLGPGPVSKRRRRAIRRSGNEGRTLADYGFCAAKKLRYWGYKLASVHTPSGFPVGYRLLSANIGEQDALRELLKVTDVEGATMAGDKGFRGAELEREMEAAGCRLIRPDRIDEKPRHGKGLRVRQSIESCYDTLKDQLGLERHNARTLAGLTARVYQKLCALAAALWFNNLLGKPGLHLTAYDH
jgi:hypothetical protein